MRFSQFFGVMFWLFSQVGYTATDFINDVPDFSQGDIEHGQEYCAPVAVSNSLVWLTDRQQDQVALIETLASKDYMNTDLKIGTNVIGVMNGVKKITNELFGGYESLEYQGWRKSNQDVTQKLPDINWLLAGISKRSAVWLNIGWYQYDSDSQQYIRNGGHWVTVVGYENDSLVIHDPATKTKTNNPFGNEYVRLNKISAGLLTGKDKGLPMSAEGYYYLDGMHLKSGTDYGIIDGAVVLKLADDVANEKPINAAPARTSRISQAW
jgi:hypothetical protein